MYLDVSVFVSKYISPLSLSLFIYKEGETDRQTDRQSIDSVKSCPNFDLKNFISTSLL